MTSHAIPVLVGASAITQRSEDPQQAREAWQLMRDAALAAAADAGAPGLLLRLDAVRVPKGLWGYSDPARLVAEAVGSPAARTTLADIGILQTSLLAEACEAIQCGRERVSLVLGGEARYRHLMGEKSGQPVAETAQTQPPDVLLQPEAELWSAAEWEHGLGMPVTYYALIENALRAAEGLSLADHRRAVAQLWAGFNAVAAANPQAWFRAPMDAAALATASPDNRMLAFPYAKWHTAQWNVDQAAALLLCSEAVADEAGVPAAQRIYPLAITESNAMTPVSARRELHRCPGYAIATARALDLARLSLQDISLFELYSCFPAAVRVQAREMGIPDGTPLTLTGGMSFAGGPLNNFVYQALVAMVQALRRQPGSNGLLTAVSGLLTKQGVSLWSAQRPPHGFAYADVSGAVREATAVCEVVDAAVGPATVASYTVSHDKAGHPVRGIIVADLPDGRRTVAHSDDPAVARAMTERECCGCRVSIGPGNVFVCGDLS